PLHPEDHVQDRWKLRLFGTREFPIIRRMVKLGSLSGSVLDANGMPETRATVQVIPVNSANPPLSLRLISPNERGEFQLTLPPGEYKLLAWSHEGLFN